MSGYVNTLLRADNPSALGQQNGSDPHDEMVRSLWPGSTTATLKSRGRTYVAKVVSARPGLCQADAPKRVDGVRAAIAANTTGHIASH